MNVPLIIVRQIHFLRLSRSWCVNETIDNLKMQPFWLSHLDLRLLLLFLFYCRRHKDGRRMATCSGDRFVRIWDLSENGDWALNAEFQGHKGSVSSLSWAHPEYGSLIATAGGTFGLGWLDADSQELLELLFSF